jgi:hypothetical protein
MPIRFRCCYCNQLLAIATRKANTVIQCPTCQGQVWVPDPANPDPGLVLEQLPPVPPAPAVPPTLFISPGKALLLLVAGLVGLILFFGAGVWVGRSLKL